LVSRTLGRRCRIAAVALDGFEPHPQLGRLAASAFGAAAGLVGSDEQQHGAEGDGAVDPPADHGSSCPCSSGWRVSRPSAQRIPRNMATTTPMAMSAPATANAV